MRIENSTNIVEITFGKISRKVIDNADSPRSLAFITKSSVTIANAAERTVCTTTHVKKKVIVRTITIMLEPKALSTINITTRFGRQIIRSTTRMPIMSYQERL